MTGYTLFPRLEVGSASRLRQELISDLDGQVGFSESELNAALLDPRAFPSTGGGRISESGLRELRSACLEAASEVASFGSEHTSAFDLALGRVLAQAGEESPGEFGDPRVWDFMTLVLLPDVAAQRLKKGGGSSGGRIPSSRLIGGDRRHVFQRLWKRWRVFGADIVIDGRLTEDDYQATLERHITLRPSLARSVAAAIVNSGYTGSARREYTRVFMRRLQQASGLVQIRDDDAAYVKAIVAHVHNQTVSSLS